MPILYRILMSGCLSGPVLAKLELALPPQLARVQSILQLEINFLEGQVTPLASK